MASKKEIMGQMRNVSVGLYCHTDDEGFEEKIENIKNFLTKNGGTCTVTRKSVSKGDANTFIQFDATIPAWFAGRHHSFDSRLNNTDPDKGFGVAWVE